MDYWERAKRQKELEKIEEYTQKENLRLREMWDKMEAERISRDREEWKSSRETKQRLSSMNADAEAFKNVLKVTLSYNYFLYKGERSFKTNVF